MSEWIPIDWQIRNDRLRNRCEGIPIEFWEIRMGKIFAFLGALRIFRRGNGAGAVGLRYRHCAFSGNPEAPPILKCDIVHAGIENCADIQLYGLQTSQLW